jgi:uncharacterized protein
MARFFQYHLRTTDVAAAKAFYATVLGRDASVVMPLHEQALAKGARPHWLGYVGVEDVDGALDAFRARGAMQLGPRAVNPSGLDMVVLRDPGGAVVALARPTPGPTFPEVVWHHLSTADLATSAASYRELFGWEVSAPTDLPRVGAVRELSWPRGAAPFGSMADITGRPEVHPHWLFHFRVASLDDAIAKVKELGGAVLAPFTLGSGARVAVCDDAQGAAFALYEAPLGA